MEKFAGRLRKDLMGHVIEGLTIIGHTWEHGIVKGSEDLGIARNPASKK